MKYGVDVSSLRSDTLEKKLLREVVITANPTVLEIGCGAGATARRLAAIDAVVTAVDINDHEAWRLSSKSITYVAADVRRWLRLTSQQQSYMYGLCSRTLHYLQYNDAVSVLCELKNIVTKKLYLSFSGLTSALAVGSNQVECSVDKRYGYLANDVQTTYQIYAPITLYNQSEVADLLQHTGWSIEEIRTTAFGNIEVVVRSR
jgi:methylase of polypeptide subunit release factors